MRCPEGLGRTAVPPLEALDVFNVRLAADSEARSLESADAEVHSVPGHDLHSLLAQVLDQLGKAKHSVRNLGLELSYAGEDDNRLGGVGGNKSRRPRTARTCRSF